MDKSKIITDDELEMLNGAMLYVTVGEGEKREAQVVCVGSKIAFKYYDDNGNRVMHYTDRSTNSLFGLIEFNILSNIDESKIINHTIALNPNERSDITPQ